MIRTFYKSGQEVMSVKNSTAFDPEHRVLWVDLQYPDAEEVMHVEQTFEVKFLSPQQTEEIESSSRYFETEDTILANSNVLVPHAEGHQNQPVSFMIKNDVLFTYRSADLKSFADTVKKIKVNPRIFNSGTQILLSIFETLIDHDADLIESMARDISAISKTLSIDNKVSEEILLKINDYQELTMLVRENIIDKQRVVSFMLKSPLFIDDNRDRLRIIIKDVHSLLEHTVFSFERLEYLQNTFLGLVNIEQNKIIKIFTVVSVVFMPPTLIASLYGMNFRAMPELNWSFGYPLAIVLMITSSLVTLYIFKKRQWL